MDAGKCCIGVGCWVSGEEGDGTGNDIGKLENLVLAIYFCERTEKEQGMLYGLDWTHTSPGGAPSMNEEASSTVDMMQYRGYSALLV